MCRQARRAACATRHTCPARRVRVVCLAMSASDPSVSATPSGEEAASADSSTPAPGDASQDANESAVNTSDQPVADSDSHPELQPPAETVATISPGGGKQSIQVTLEPPQEGKRKLTAWVWRFVSRFSPTINDKNVVCLVKGPEGKICGHLLKWSSSTTQAQRGSGTTGLAKHLEKFHPAVVKGAKEETGTKEERKAPIRAAVAGRESPEASGGTPQSSLLEYMSRKMDKK
ncbi:unnamed protein product, partial [Pylaiella littoralis]